MYTSAHSFQGEDDGTRLLPASSYVQNREGEKPVGVYAIYDAAQAIQYVGFSRNIVLSVKVRDHAQRTQRAIAQHPSFVAAPSCIRSRRMCCWMHCVALPAGSLQSSIHSSCTCWQRVLTCMAAWHARTDCLTSSLLAPPPGAPEQGGRGQVCLRASQDLPGQSHPQPCQSRARGALTSHPPPPALATCTLDSTPAMPCLPECCCSVHLPHTVVAAAPLPDLPTPTGHSQGSARAHVARGEVLLAPAAILPRPQHRCGPNQHHHSSRRPRLAGKDGQCPDTLGCTTCM
jgi:hypothetical protein